MTPTEFEPLELLMREKMVSMLESITPPEGMNDTDFTNFIQAGVWCLYCQLRENLGAKAGMMAIGEVLQVAAQQDGAAVGVHVDMIQMPKGHGTKQ